MFVCCDGVVLILDERANFLQADRKLVNICDKNVVILLYVYDFF